MSNLHRSNFQGHPFHLVSPSPLFLFTCISLLSLTTSGVLTIFVFFIPSVLSPPPPCVDFSVIPELDITTKGLGLGLSILLGISLVLGLKWSRKGDKHHLNLWLVAGLVLLGDVYQASVIDLWDRNGVYLSMLLSSMPSVYAVTGPIQVSTPIGLFKGFLTSTQVTQEIYEILVSDSIPRFSLFDVNTFDVTINRGIYNFLSRRFIINIYSGFNTGFINASSVDENYHNHPNILLLGPSKLVTVPLPNTASRYGLDR